MKTPFRISCDDGCASDMRLAELCMKYMFDDVVFYIPAEWNSLAHAHGYKPLMLGEVEALASRFELGGHTITHRHLTAIPSYEAKYEIIVGTSIMEQLFNVKITKFCAPRGYTNPELTEFTLAHYELQRLTKGPGLVHIHPDSGANNNRPWRDCIDENTTELWCHSWELDKYDLWKELEEVLSEHSPL